MARIDINNYPGSKNHQGTLRRIINQIPEHKVMFELYGGSAVIGRNVYEDQQNSVLIINDISPSVYAELSILPELQKPNISVLNINAVSVLSLIKSLCDIGIFKANDIFIYLDPPYLKSTRKSSADIYEFEYTEDDHLKLISTILELECRIMLSGYDCKLYNDGLPGWFTDKWPVMTRGGKAFEKLWMNYNPKKVPLHTYKFIGKDFTDRQRIKRKNDSMIKRFKSLPDREREFLVRSIIENFG